MTYYSAEVAEIIREFETDPEKGLGTGEAARRLERDGKNEIPKVKRGFVKIYLAPLFNWLIVIYLIGSLILFLDSLTGGEGNLQMLVITLGIVVINMLVAIFQQYRATKKLKALRELSAPTTQIIRGGERMEIPTKEVVVGDLLVLSQGDKIPADARIIRSANLEVNEASLTGESEPVKKNNGQPLGDRHVSMADRRNMVFYGTYITMGTGYAITVQTGGNTEIGKISKGLDEAGTSEIPIRQKMNNFGKWLGLMVAAFWGVVWVIRFLSTGDTSVFRSLNSAMDIMPLNIPLLTTIVMITGVLSMAQEGVIIRNLTSVDSLGRISVVCSDKTGTLTESKMCVQNVLTLDRVFEVTGVGYKPEGEIKLKTTAGNPSPITNFNEYPNLKLLLISGYLNNKAAIKKKDISTDGNEVDKWDVIGSPTEGALITLYRKTIDEKPSNHFNSVVEYPFDSSLKRMSTVFQNTEKNNIYVYSKGASEALIPLCSKIMKEDGIIEFSDNIKQDVYNKVNNFAAKGYRVLSLAYKGMGSIPSEDEEGRAIAESNLIYLGFVTMLDPPRAGVKESVKQAHNAGVRTVMITGDSGATARAIAQQISIVQDEKAIVIEGKDIEQPRSNEEFNNIRVFARVSPKHKETIVRRYQEQDKVVAMTGDGVNDALALNMADVGVAMGIQGTDVAKEASDMIISDDSFNSIVKGIKEGRGIFARIRSIVFFYIATNVFEGLVQFVLAIILNLPYFLDDAFYFQWLFLSVTVHMFPGLILTFDTTAKDVMEETPRDEEEILSGNILKLLLTFGLLLAVAMFTIYFLCYSGTWPIFDGNYQFANPDDFLYSDYFTLDLMESKYGFDRGSFEDICAALGLPATIETLRRFAKCLTMLMAVLYVSETVMVLQIRRVNKSLWKALKEDSNVSMFLVIGLLYFLFLSLIYWPRVQTALAFWGFNFMFMYLTALDWALVGVVSLITIGGLEIYKLIARKKGIFF